MVTLPPGPSTFPQEEKTNDKRKNAKNSLNLLFIFNNYLVKIQLQAEMNVLQLTQDLIF